MSKIKNHLEREIERISKETGYPFFVLLDAFQEMILIEEDVNIGQLEKMAKEKHPMLARIAMMQRRPANN